VTEILFYHMQRQPLEQVLPSLLEKSLERQWRVAVQATSEERLQALDDHLWIFSDESFLPHGTDRDPDCATQPVVLTLRDANPNAASIRFLVEGAALPDDRFASVTGKADTEPMFPDNPYLAANRRVTVTLLAEPPPTPNGKAVP
jgi:DNA polymerase IIIc chi subunit